MKIQFCLIKTASVFCFISFHKKKFNSVSFHKKKIWFCLISQKKIQFCLISLKKNLILSHLMKKKSDSVSSYWKKIWFCFISSKKNWFCFILSKKNLISFWFYSESESEWDRKSWFWQSVYNLKWMKKDKVVIISHYHSYVSQNQKILSYFNFILFYLIK